MAIGISQIKDILIEKDLRVTPQRIAILEAIYNQNNHPSAEMIQDYIKDTYPGISTATIYKVLDVLIENKLITRVKTERDIMRYDANLENHHHLYCLETGDIRDYRDEELNNLLSDYFRRKGIENFEIQDTRLQIQGKFLNPAKK